MASDSVDLGSTSPTLPTTLPATLNSSSSSGNSYTFLIHSDSSQSSQSFDNASFLGDKYAHTRTKRKRTSAEDFAVLEAEYQSNPRPEKALRLEIVNRVSLTEKEVQIWFQNRRQMTRRKCRTWQPNEITSIIRSTQEGANPMSWQTESNEPPTDEDSMQGSQSPIDSTELPVVATSISTSENDDGVHVPETTTEQLSNAPQGPSQEQSIPIVNSAADTSKPALPADPASSSDAKNPPVSKDYGSNNIEMNAPSSQNTGTRINAITPKKQLKRTSSSVRLSMSFDGKAEVRIGDSPSPPKKQITSAFFSRPSGLQRSQSEIGPSKSKSFSDLDTSSGWQGPKIPGRSRDARTWEFYCDSDARDALTKTAERAQKGSALGVIGLIRAGSAGRKPLAPMSSNNQKSHLQRTGSGKRKALSKHEGLKSKLARTASSVARLETDASKLRHQQSEKDLKTSKQTDIWEDPQGDSDKENWVPGTCQRGTRPAASSSATTERGILQENTQLLSHSSSFKALMDKDITLSNRRQKQTRPGPGSTDKENFEVDDEVSAFIGGAKNGRADDELDAVQNLLSLSQGAWR